MKRSAGAAGDGHRSPCGRAVENHAFARPYDHNFAASERIELQPHHDG
jgi:hypothetical protein